MLRGVLQTAYLGAGAFVAYTHTYFSVSDWKTALSALAAVLLWPLQLMGVNMHFSTLI